MILYALRDSAEATNAWRLEAWCEGISVYLALYSLRYIPCRNIPCRNVPCRNIPCRNIPCRNIPYRSIPWWSLRGAWGFFGVPGRPLWVPGGPLGLSGMSLELLGVSGRALGVPEKSGIPQGALEIIDKYIYLFYCIFINLQNHYIHNVIAMNLYCNIKDHKKHWFSNIFSFMTSQIGPEDPPTPSQARP